MSGIHRTCGIEEYRLFLLPSRSKTLFAHREGLCWRLPRIGIPKHTRPAKQLQQAVADNFGLHVVILDLPAVKPTHLRCVVAEVRSQQSQNHLTVVPWTDIPEEDLPSPDKDILQSIVSGGRGPLARLGWIEEAISWIQSTISGAVVDLDGVCQYNAGGGFGLVRFALSDGGACWLKAVGAPNHQEFDITYLLTRIYPEGLPTLLANRRDWNAWLMEDAGDSLMSRRQLPALEHAASVLGALQKACLSKCRELLNAGASNQELGALRRSIPELVEYLSLAMGCQTSTKVPRLSAKRLIEIGERLKEACDCLDELSIPDTLIHNDINSSNILCKESRCVITDWSEAGVGNPFFAFAHLTSLTKSEGVRARLRAIYQENWSDTLSAKQTGKAFCLAPLVAVASFLYGRGDWMASPSRNDPTFQSCARSLARHMDRAAREQELQEALRT